jgi:hypothetical protein
MNRFDRNAFSWSHSRHEVFGECLRRYYYHYYGAWGGWKADADPDTRRLYALKQLKSRHLWAGGHVHAAVASVLQPLRSGERGLPEPRAALSERTAESTLKRMREEFRASRAQAYLRDPRHTLGLIEHHYAEAVSDDDWKALAENVRRAIIGFFHNPHLTEIEAVDPRAFLALEDLDTFDVSGVPAYVKLDLAYRLPDGARILDWKTGRRTPRPESLQLGGYALYAAQRWGIAPASIEVCEVNLTTGEEAAARVSDEQLAGTRDAIASSIRAMRARLQDPEANAARVEDFPAQLSQRACQQCPFREACPEYARDGHPSPPAMM